MSAAANDGFLSNEELVRTQESKRRRRETLLALVKDAGMSPADVDVTQIMSDEEQAEVVRQQVARKEAQRLAQECGAREALRARFKKTVETRVAVASDAASNSPTNAELNDAAADEEGKP